MGRSSASHGKKPARKLPKKQWKTVERQSAESQDKVVRKANRVHQRDRRVDTAVPLKARKLTLGEKHLRATNKKLREIEALQERRDAGEELDEQQLAKIERLGDVLAEMASLMAKGSAEPSGL